MKATISHSSGTFEVDFSKPLDLSIPLRNGVENPNAWYLAPPVISPVKSDGFIGDVSQGGSVNFRDIYFNPHGHGTHTECVGHISKEEHNVNDAFTQYFFLAQVVSIEPEKANEDEIIRKNQVMPLLSEMAVEALVMRTLPNVEEKKTRKYSHTNPPYVEPDLMTALIGRGVDHFLIDLPSVDREEDGGALSAHKAFWEYPEAPDLRRTITEFIYVPDQVVDGLYFMNLQVANFANDASPSRPVLYPITS